MSGSVDILLVSITDADINVGSGNAHLAKGGMSWGQSWGQTYTAPINVDFTDSVLAVEHDKSRSGNWGSTIWGDLWGIKDPPTDILSETTQSELESELQSKFEGHWGGEWGQRWGLIFSMAEVRCANKD